MRLFFFTLVVGLLISSGVSGQVNMIFMPDLNGKTVEGLGNFQVQNSTGKAISGSITIVIKDNKTNGTVVTVLTPSLQIPSGLSQFPRNVFISARLIFTDNAVSRIVSQTKSFPVGDYSYCYQFKSDFKVNGSDYESCYDAEIQPLVPISLISPNDKDSICEKRPSLSWQPPLPYTPGMRFRVLLTEKKQGESVENLLVNLPLIYLDNVSGTTINYPLASPELKEGKTYCWQVIAYQDGIILSKSEIWEFTVQCNEPKQLVNTDSYRELKLLTNGNFYLAEGAIRFSYVNIYHLKKLSYDIIDVENAAKKVKNPPDINLIQGLNKINLDLTDLNLKEGNYYLLRVYPFNESIIEIKFKYLDVK